MLSIEVSPVFFSFHSINRHWTCCFKLLFRHILPTTMLKKKTKSVPEYVNNVSYQNIFKWFGFFFPFLQLFVVRFSQSEGSLAHMVIFKNTFFHLFFPFFKMEKSLLQLRQQSFYQAARNAENEKNFLSQS